MHTGTLILNRMPNMLKTAPNELFTSLDITVQSLMSAVRLLISSDEKVLAFYLCSTIVQLLVGNYFTTFIIHWIRISGTSVVGKAIVFFIN